MRIFQVQTRRGGLFSRPDLSRNPGKFPLTKFFIEVSSQWVPYAIHDFARRFERAGKKVDKGEVLRKNRIYVACQTDDDLPYVLKYTGEDHLVIGTDYGHNDTSSEILALRKLREDGAVPPQIVNKILDDNARRCTACRPDYSRCEENHDRVSI